MFFCTVVLLYCSAILTEPVSLARYFLINFALKKQESAKKELAILDAKRSNVINIGLTALPPPRTIKTAIVKMDSAIMNREAIEVGFPGSVAPSEQNIEPIFVEVSFVHLRLVSNLN